MCMSVCHRGWTVGQLEGGISQDVYSPTHNVMKRETFENVEELSPGKGRVALFK